jgi:hypothetical protein
MGNIILYNNGYGRRPPYSTVDEIIPPMDSTGFYHLGDDSAYGPVGPEWQFVTTPPESMYSSLLSGCQRLPNGNTLICVGLTGTMLEVTPEGNLVWKYINPVTSAGPQQQGRIIPVGANQVFKVRRYPPDYPGLAGRNLNPIGPIETYPQAVEEHPAKETAQPLCPAVVRSSITITGIKEAELVDITGRTRMRLLPGRNEIKNLGAGVYFLITESWPTTKKVIVER